MFDEANPPEDSETIDALLAANNGIVNALAILAICLRKRNLMTKDELKAMADELGKPFDQPYVTENRVAQSLSANIATLFSNLK